MEIWVRTKIDFDKLADLVVIGMECNPFTKSWMRSCALINSVTPAQEVWYSDPEIYKGGFEVRFTTRSDDLYKPDRVIFKSSRNFRAALQFMDDKYPKHFYDFKTGNPDTLTADVYLQLAAFGAIKFKTDGAMVCSGL